MNSDYKNAHIGNSDTIDISTTGKWKVGFFVWLILGYIICLPIASLASMAATVLGMAVCGIYFLILRAFIRASINEYGTYLDSILYAQQHNALSAEEASRYQRMLQDLQRKKAFWKIVGISIPILCIAVVIIYLCVQVASIADLENASGNGTVMSYNYEFNTGFPVMTLILLLSPSYMYQQLIDFLEVNDLRNQLKNHNR